MEIIQATVIKQNQALRLRARKECFDRDGKERVTGRSDCGTVVLGQAGRREGPPCRGSKRNHVKPEN